MDKPRRSTRYPSAIERLASGVRINTETGCWQWIRSTYQGYGKLSSGGRLRPAHRVSYALYREPIPAGLQIDHLCRNRGCVNPWHLEAVTARENSLRSQNVGAINAKKTHCSNGHPFNDENTIRTKRQRMCRACKRAGGLELKRRIRSLKPPNPAATYCKNGHHKATAGVYMDQGRPRCADCVRAKARRLYSRRKNAAA